MRNLEVLLRHTVCHACCPLDQRALQRDEAVNVSVKLPFEQINVSQKDRLFLPNLFDVFCRVVDVKYAVGRHQHPHLNSVLDHCHHIRQVPLNVHLELLAYNSFKLWQVDSPVLEGRLSILNQNIVILLCDFDCLFEVNLLETLLHLPVVQPPQPIKVEFVKNFLDASRQLIRGVEELQNLRAQGLKPPSVDVHRLSLVEPRDRLLLVCPRRCRHKIVEESGDDDLQHHPNKHKNQKH
mmetsp:Transcript_5190/g.12028  ORF Transcript_5190/g.12028 Transcript_5190/m.12028 type:complete len:238 (+) Transcript_5190:348-1061(+)